MDIEEEKLIMFGERFTLMAIPDRSSWFWLRTLVFKQRPATEF